MLTNAELKAEVHLRGVHEATWEQMRNRLIGKWVLTACTAFLLGAGGIGVVIFIGSLVAMLVHHHRELDLWRALHRPAPEPPVRAIDPAEAERIVAEWQPPTGYGPASAA